MYYKNYFVEDSNSIKYDYKDINILRFSYNKFTIEEEEIDDKKIKDFLNKLKEIAENDKKCYKVIYPWEDIEEDDNNKEIIIAYNIKTNHIQGWCNIKYEKINSTDEKSLYTLHIEKLVSREIPKNPKYIGLLLLEFIKDNCFNKEIIFKDLDEDFNSIYVSKKLDIMYLYSLTTSIDFYKRTFFINIIKDISDPDYNLLQHVFIYLAEKYQSRYKEFIDKMLKSMEILHIFELDSKLDEDDKLIYQDFKPDIRCLNKNPSINKEYNLLTLSDIKYLSNIVFDKLKRNKTILDISSSELSFRSNIRKKIKSIKGET